MEQISRRTLLAAIGAVGTTAVAGCSDDSEPVDIASTHRVGGDKGSGSDSGSGSGSSSDSASPTDSALQTVELDPPDTLRGRWAAIAAVWTAVEVSDDGSGPRATNGDWEYSMELGEWAHLLRYSDGRALLVGQSDPDLMRSVTDEKKMRKALTAGAPTWWNDADELLPSNASVGFVLGWDRKRWQRVSGVPSEGGFDKMTFYPRDDDTTIEWLLLWGQEGESEHSSALRSAAAAVIKAGTRVNMSQLQRLGPGMQADQLKDAVAAAKAFEGKGRRR